MRRMVVPFSAFLIAVGFLGENWRPIWNWFYGEPPPMIEALFGSFQWFEQMLLGWGMYPSLIFAGLTGVVVALAWPSIWERLCGHKAAAASFERELSEAGVDRDQLWKCMDNAYKRMRSEDRPRTLSSALELAKVPERLPLPENESLAEWAANAATSDLGHNSFHIYTVALDLFPPSPEGPYQNDELRRVHRNVAEFWDKWGRAMHRKRLRPSDVRLHLKSCALELKALVYMEMAFARQSRRDKGPGKFGLFYIAHKAQEAAKVV